MKSELESIVEEGYELFSKYRLSGKLDVCPCCVSLEEQDQLVKTPVAKIGVELLGIYNNSAMAEVIDANELKYFLPRILELVSLFDFPSHSTEIALSRIGYISKQKWTEEENSFLTKFMKAVFRNCLDLYPLENESLVSIIIMFSKTGFDIRWVTEEWVNMTGLNPLLHFVETIENEITTSRKGKLKIDNAFADERMEFLAGWLQNRATIKIFKERIEDFLVNKNYRGEHSAKLDKAYEYFNLM
ncbi:MAG: hypothetical protein QM791_18825 [Ferruginibacter sp.]